MPLNPSIILGVRPPEDPVASMGRALSLRNMGQQQQIHAQQLQSGELGLQQQKQGMADDQAIRRLFANGNPTDADIMRTAGAKGSAIIKSRYEANEAAGKLKELTGKVAAAEGDYLGSLGMMVKNADYSPEAFGSLIQHATDAGYGSHMQPLIAAAQQDPASIKALVDRMIDASPAQKKLANETITATAHADTVANTAANNAPKTAAAWAATAGQLLGAAQSQDQWDAALAKLPPDVRKGYAPMFSPEAAQQAANYGLTPEQRATLAGQKETRAETSRHNTVDETTAAGRLRVAQGELGTAQGRLAVEKQRFGFESGGGISPQAQFAAEGKMDPKLLRSMLRSNPGLITQIRKVDPEFDEANIERRFDTLKEFNSSSNTKAGGQALALNTLIHHADLYMLAAEGLKNKTFRPGNAVYNAVANAFGAAPPTNAALLARFFAGETGKVATGGVPAEGEINGILKNLSNDASPDQIKGAGNTLLQIAAGRATPLIERVNESKLGNVVHVIGPDAKEILNRRGFDPETMKLRGTAPAVLPKGDGKAIDKATAQQFYQAAGGDPVKAQKLAEEKGWKVQ